MKFFDRFKKIKPLPGVKIYTGSLWEEHEELWIGLIFFIILGVIAYFWSDYQILKNIESNRPICNDYCHEIMGDYGNYSNFEWCIEDCIKDKDMPY